MKPLRDYQAEKCNGCSGEVCEVNASGAAYLPAAWKCVRADSTCGLAILDRADGLPSFDNRCVSGFSRNFKREAYVCATIGFNEALQCGPQNHCWPVVEWFLARRRALWLQSISEPLLTTRRRLRPIGTER